MHEYKGPKNPGERNRDKDSDERNRRIRRNTRQGNLKENYQDEEVTILNSQIDDDFLEETNELLYEGRIFTTERFDASTQGDHTTRTTSVANERAILVGVYMPGQGVGEEPLTELAGLAEAANVEPVGTLIQRRTTPNAAYCLGRGKLDELEELIHASTLRSCF